MKAQLQLATVITAPFTHLKNSFFAHALLFSVLGGFLRPVRRVLSKGFALISELVIRDHLLLTLCNSTPKVVSIWSGLWGGSRRGVGRRGARHAPRTPHSARTLPGAGGPPLPDRLLHPWTEPIVCSRRAEVFSGEA